MSTKPRQDLPVNALRILAHLSISLGKSPVTGQKCSVPNFFSAISLTRPPILSDQMVDLSMATLPHAPPLAFILACHPEGSASAGFATGVCSLRGGGGGGAFDIFVAWLIVWLMEAHEICIFLSLSRMTEPREPASFHMLIGYFRRISPATPPTRQDGSNGSETRPCSLDVHQQQCQQEQ
jgi:hypothetical protein